jgi:hypothetical protein
MKGDTTMRIMEWYVSVGGFSDVPSKQVIDSRASVRALCLRTAIQAA